MCTNDNGGAEWLKVIEDLERATTMARSLHDDGTAADFDAEAALESMQRTAQQRLDAALTIEGVQEGPEEPEDLWSSPTPFELIKLTKALTDQIEKAESAMGELRLRATAAQAEANTAAEQIEALQVLAPSFARVRPFILWSSDVGAFESGRRSSPREGARPRGLWRRSRIRWSRHRES